MQFNSPHLNKQRYRKHFAFLPITINGTTKWLEVVEYYEEYYAPNEIYGWYRVDWITDKNRKYYQQLKK